VLYQDGSCKYKASSRGATVSGYVDVPHGNERKLQEAVATVGPVSVAIDANHASFMLYRSGRYFVAADCVGFALLPVGLGKFSLVGFEIGCRLSLVYSRVPLKLADTL